MAAPGPSVRSMSDVKARIMNPATTSFYDVFFTPPNNVKSNASKTYGLNINGTVQEYMQFACTEALLPGSRLMTHETTNDFSGVTEKTAYRRQYDGELSLTFYVDRDYTPIRLFESWIGYIGGENKSMGPKYSPTDRKTGYRVPFPMDYQVDNLTITKFEKDVGRSDFKSSIRYVFYGAFPLSVNSMPISYGPSETLKVTVNMSYIRYVVTYSPSNGFGNDSRTNDTRASDPNGAVLDGLSEQGFATVYDPFGSSVTFYDGNDGQLDF